MNAFTSLELAELRRHEFRADAARARLATRARRARHQPAHQPQGDPPNGKDKP
jgi:hypothetical protein